MEVRSDDYPEREWLRDQLFAHPEGCEETFTTPISRGDYVRVRREWMQRTVRACGAIGITLAGKVFDIAFMSDEQLRNQRKPKHVVTWFDCGEELDAQVSRYRKKV